jgi:deazaflavin-dependent oxidoreductase (nitroreductase family)
MSATEPSFVRPRPGWLLRLFFKVPVLLYRGWLAELLRARCVLLLTTTGRRTGRPRTTGVSFLPLEDRYVIFAGWGVRADWYRNLLANPEVTLQIGRQRLRATAVPVRDPARRRALMLQMQARSAQCGPPPWIRPLLRLTRVFDYDREIAMAVEHAETLPVVELFPHT